MEVVDTDASAEGFGRALFVLRVQSASRRHVLAEALTLGMQGAGGAGELLFLAPTDDPEKLGRLAEALASLDGVRDVRCSVLAL
ncbi:MAG: hypothetical protein LC624_03190 [Halobacteriales archaeon]|nr:hypothetical protein [Halobacteriales archaeon]